MKNEACKVALSALEMAMEEERQGGAFYAQAAERVQDPMGKAVFQALAQDEVKHLKLLQAEYEQVSNEQEFMELDEAMVCQPKTPLRIYPDKRNKKLVISRKATDLDALTIAMDLERKGYDLYTKAGTETDDPAGKKVFAFLARQENQHYVFLQKTQEYLRTQGTWYFEEQEFPIFDGA
jgi:rubrerythrin